MGYTLYIAERGQEYGVFYTPEPACDLSYWQERGYTVSFLTKPLPIGLVYSLKKEVVKTLEGSLPDKIISLFSPTGSRADKGRRACSRVLAAFGLGKNLLAGGDGLRLSKGQTWGPGADDMDVVMKRLAGRALLRPELVRNIKEAGLCLAGPPDLIIQRLYLEGLVDILPGVGYEKPGRLKCYRCGSSRKIVESDCPRCGMKCYYCEECILLGTARFCEPLFIGRGLDYAASGCQVSPPAPLFSAAPVRPVLPFDVLTPAQQAASDEVVGFVLDEGAEMGLVWAVCGAGKTEVAFAGVAAALNQGLRVLYTVPRRDVVAELYPRFREAFPGVSVTAVYGGSSHKYAEAAITLATTHQLVRFSGRFDLVILDEADAYPYRESSFLPGVLERARRQNSKLLYMTATPDPGTLQEMRRRKGKIVTLPARHHGHTLPVPKVLQRSVIKRGAFDRQLLEWLYIHGVREQAPVFIFVPSLSRGKEAAALLQSFFDREWGVAPFDAGRGAAHSWGTAPLDRRGANPSARGKPIVEFVHAGDRERDHKREKFRVGEINFLVTTTVLERGITIPGAHVAVLWADDERVFTRETLVQAAGRAGRSARFPAGDVLFIAPEISAPMQAAIEEINYFNKIAREKGLVR